MVDFCDLFDFDDEDKEGVSKELLKEKKKVCDALIEMNPQLFSELHKNICDLYTPISNGRKIHWTTFVYEIFESYVTFEFIYDDDSEYIDIFQNCTPSLQYTLLVDMGNQVEMNPRVNTHK